MGKKTWKNKPNYERAHCDDIVVMGSRGKSRAQMAAHIGISRRLLGMWADKHPEFKDALEYANTLSLSWWENEGQKNLRRRGFNVGLYNRIISARFRKDYAERLVVAGDEDAPLVTRIERTIVRPKNTNR